MASVASFRQPNVSFLEVQATLRSSAPGRALPMDTLDCSPRTRHPASSRLRMPTAVVGRRRSRPRPAGRSTSLWGGRIARQLRTRRPSRCGASLGHGCGDVHLTGKTTVRPSAGNASSAAQVCGPRCSDEEDARRKDFRSGPAIRKWAPLANRGRRLKHVRRCGIGPRRAGKARWAPHARREWRDHDAFIQRCRALLARQQPGGVYGS